MAANMEKLVALVNSFGSAVISVGQEVGLTVTLNKAEVTQGIKVANICSVALIGLVGTGTRGTIVIMLNQDGFHSVVSKMSGGMITPSLDDGVSMSVVGELSNMVSGRAITQSSLTGVDVTPPQLIVGNQIQNVPRVGPGIKNFTLPFNIQPGGVLYLVLSFEES